MKMKPTLAIACAILLFFSCKKITEWIPDHGGGHNNGPSRLKEVSGNTKHILLYYNGEGLLDSLRLNSPAYNGPAYDGYLFRYIRHGNIIDAVVVTNNGNSAYALTEFHYDDQGRIKDYVMGDHHYGVTYDEQGNITVVLRRYGPGSTTDVMTYDTSGNVITWVTYEGKGSYPDRFTYAYDTGANPLYIKDIFLALLRFDYQEFIFSRNNATQKNHVSPASDHYNIQNQYDSKNRLVKKTYTLTSGYGQNDTLYFRYY